MSTHPINPLTNDGVSMLRDRTIDALAAIDGFFRDGTAEFCDRVLPLERYNEVVAYFGTIRDHVETIQDLLFGDAELLRSEGLVDELDESSLSKQRMLATIETIARAHDDMAAVATVSAGAASEFRIPDRIAEQLIAESTIVQRVSDKDLQVLTADGAYLQMWREFPNNVNQWLVRPLECSPTDVCDPHGIPRPHTCGEGAPTIVDGHPVELEQHTEALAVLLTGIGQVPDNALDRYIAQVERGVITHSEFEALRDNYWQQRDMFEATDVEKCDWLYDHDVLDAQAYWAALDDCWINHDVATCHDDACEFCSTHMDEWRNMHLTRRFPQITGAPSVCDPDAIG